MNCVLHVKVEDATFLLLRTLLLILFSLLENPQSSKLILAFSPRKLFLETEQSAHISHPLTPKQEL